MVLVRVPSEMKRPSQTESMMAFFDTTSGARAVMKTSRSITMGSRCRVSCPDTNSLLCGRTSQSPSRKDPLVSSVGAVLGRMAAPL